jgi:cytochrome b561
MALLWRNSPARYGLVALVFHWLIALAIIGMLVLGSIMTDLPNSPEKFKLYQLHKSVGMTILAASLLRLGWRLANPAPPLPPTVPRLEAMAAKSTHAAFYLLMIGLPVSGWMMVSASTWNIPTRIFGLFTLPHLPWFSTLADKKPVEDALKVVHEMAGWVLAALLLLHVAAALRHHLLLKDDILRRMLPGRGLWQR